MRIWRRNTENVFIQEYVDDENGDGELTKHIASVKGFLGFELFKTNKDNYEEVVVVSKWEDEEAQKAWVKSDSFKKAHGQTKASHEKQRDRTGIIGNSITQYEVAHSKATNH